MNRSIGSEVVGIVAPRSSGWMASASSAEECARSRIPSNLVLSGKSSTLPLAAEAAGRDGVV
jgi:hypothetical protein